MVKFKIDDIEYVIGDFITIEQYVKIYKVKDLFTEQYFAARLINILSGCPVEVLLDSEYESIQYLASYILQLLPQQDIKFIDRFELNGEQYGFFPSWKELTFAEFVDLDTISTKKPDEVLDLLHVLAAIMFRPITEDTSRHKFEIEPYDVQSMKKRSELFKTQLDVKYVIAAQFFFIKFAKIYSSYSQLYLVKNLSLWKQIQLIWRVQRLIVKSRSRKPSDGLPSLIELLKTILSDTKPSLEKA
jgi:hypothetical protein